MKPLVDVVVAGAGSNGAAEEGALSVIEKHFEIARIGGASAGSINAAGKAAGIEDMSKLWAKFLTRGDLEDWHLPGILRPAGVLKSSPRCGMMAGKVISKALVEVFGTMRMGDLKKPCRIVVGNLARRRIETIDSTAIEHKDLFVANVVRCSSAVPFVMDAWQIRPSDPTLYTDGGTGANVPADLWDDEPTRPTIVIRFYEDESLSPIRSIKDFALAIFNIRCDAANGSHPSRKDPKNLIFVDIKSNGDSLDFSLDAVEVQRRRMAGILAARAVFEGNDE